MKLSRIALAGALSLTLALAGCSNGEEPTPEPDATSSEAPEVELDLPEQSEEELNEQLAPDTEAEVDSGLNPDAHPLCAALIDFEEIGGGDENYEPTEADLPQIKEKSAAAVAAAPAEIKDDVKYYLDTVIELSERSIAGEDITDQNFEDMGEEVQESFAAVMGFMFDTCLDIDIDFDFE